jgi:hypothetical protein
VPESDRGFVDVDRGAFDGCLHMSNSWSSVSDGVVAAQLRVTRLSISAPATMPNKANRKPWFVSR